MSIARNWTALGLGLSLTFAVAACDKLVTEGAESRDDVAMTLIIKAAAASKIVDTGAPGVEISASIDENVDDAKKTITFVTSAGWWVENATKTITIRAVKDPKNQGKLVARSLLRDSLPHVAIVRASIGDVYDTVSVTFKKP
jgi:hypothetical protein